MVNVADMETSSSDLVVNVSEYEALAKQKLPKMAYDFYASGAEDQWTLHHNTTAFSTIRLRPRVLVDVSKVDISTSILGFKIPMPIMVAPTALHKLAHPEGELATARAAASMGTIMVLSFSSSFSVEDVAEAGGGVKFFQLYVYKDRKIAETLVLRAEKAGYKAIVLTGDTPRLGRREADIRNRFVLPPHVTMKNLDGLFSVELDKSKGSGLEAHAASTMDRSLSWKIWVGDSSHMQDSAQFLASCIDAFSIACCHTVSENRRHLFSRERQLQDRLACIRRRLQEFPGDTFLGDMQRETVDTLTHLQEEKSEFTYHASVSTWISKADRMNKDFFSCVRQCPAGTMVRALRDSLGQLHTCPDEILEMASVYYETLFTSDPLTRDVHFFRDEVWSFACPVASEDMQIAIMRAFSLQEVTDAVHWASYPGDDRLTRQFFMQYWDLISQPL
ncbi:hypothetical protein L7F22_029969 [Adiantum nelumboides]|nr:hypothetical protein [Adiantum nelumboides]